MAFTRANRGNSEDLPDFEKNIVKIISRRGKSASVDVARAMYPRMLNIRPRVSQVSVSMKRLEKKGVLVRTRKQGRKAYYELAGATAGRIPALQPAGRIKAVAFAAIAIAIFAAFAGMTGLFLQQDSIDLSLASEAAEHGQMFTYTLGNSQPFDMKGVTAQIFLPANSSVSDSGGAYVKQTAEGITLTWEASSIKSGSSQQFVFFGEAEGSVQMRASAVAESVRDAEADSYFAQLTADRAFYRQLNFGSGSIERLDISLSAEPAEGAAAGNNATENATGGTMPEETTEPEQNQTSESEQNETTVPEQNETKEQPAEAPEEQPAAEAPETPITGMFLGGAPPVLNIYIDSDSEWNGNERLIGTMAVDGAQSSSFSASLPQGEYPASPSMVLVSDDSMAVTVNSVAASIRETFMLESNRTVVVAGLNATEIPYVKIEEDARYDAIIDSSELSEDGTLTVIFHHNSTQAQPVFVEGDTDYMLSKDMAEPYENITLTIPGWTEDDYFELYIGSATEAMAFGEPQFYEFNATIEDASGAKKNAIVEFRHARTKKLKDVIGPEDGSARIKEGYYDITVIPEDGPIKEIDFPGIRMDTDVEEFVKLDNPKENVYSIDPAGFTFNSATVTATARASHLYKCKEWNFTEQACSGDWALVMSGLTPGQNYSFELTQDDPAYMEINITGAQHLDANRSVLSDIFNETRDLDGTWSETIYDGEYVRATFDSVMTNGNTINLYVRGNATRVEAYEQDGETLLGSTPEISGEGMHNIILSGLDTPADMFDLKVMGGALEFDYIHDANWISPNSAEDPDSKWNNEAGAYDGNTGTYATDTSGGTTTGWGSFIIFNVTSTIYSDKVRVYADYGYGYVDSVDVDIYRDGDWTDVHEGAIADNQWDELEFAGGNLSAARFRYHYSSAGAHFWLYEMQFYNTTPSVSQPSGMTNDATSVEEYNAVLHGQVTDDGGETCKVRFQYGLTEAYGANTAWLNKSTNENFTAFLNGLQNGATYHFRAQINNSAGLVNGTDRNFTTGPAALGWVSATGYLDPDSQWTDEEYAYDDDVTTKAKSYHDMNDPDGLWSFPLYLNKSPQIRSDKVRFYAKAVGIDAVNISVQKDGVWEQIYSGGFSDLTWVNASFAEGVVTGAMAQFKAANAGDGTFWEIYEFDFLKTGDANPPQAVENLVNESQSETWIEWSWTNPSDPDFNKTLLYLNGTSIANVSGENYNITGLKQGTAYELTANTMDDSGNVNSTNVTDMAMTAGIFEEDSPAEVTIWHPQNKSYDSRVAEMRSFVTCGNHTPSSVWYSLNGGANTSVSRLNTDWPRFRGNINNTGYMGSAPVLSNATFWKVFNATGTYDDFMSATVVDGVVYMGSKTNAGWARAYNATTGEQLWEFYPYDQCWDGAFAKHPDKDIIYLGCRKPGYHNYFYALNSTTGKQVWNWTASGSAEFRISGSPVYKDDVVYFCNWYSPYRLWAVNATTGADIWNYTLPTHCVNSPALGYDKYVNQWALYVATYTATNGVHAVYLNGTRRWQASADKIWDSSPVIVNDDILYMGTSNGYVYALNRSTGAAVWSASGFTNIYGTLATDGTYVYFTAGNGYLYQYNITNGSASSPSTYNWRYYVGTADAYSSVGLSDGGVAYAVSGYLAAGTNRSVYAVNATNGQLLWRYLLGNNSFSSAVISDGILYIGSDDRYLYAIGSGPAYTYNSAIAPRQGANTLTVYANNSDGTVNHTTVVFDYQPKPTVTLTSPAAGYSVNNETANVAFNATVTDEFALTNCTLYHNATGAWAANQTQEVTGTSNTTSFAINGLGNVSFIWNIMCYNNISQQGWGASNRSAVIDTYPKYSSIKEPADPATYSPGASYQFNATWTDNKGISSVILEFNGTNYTVSTQQGGEYYRTMASLPAATYNYRWYASDTLGQWNKTSQYTYTVNRAASSVSVGFAPSGSETYGTQTNATCSIIAGDAGATLALQRNGSGVANPESEVLGAGAYNYTCIYAQSENYTASSSLNNHLAIAKAPTSTALYIDDSRANKTITYGATTNATAATSAGTARLYRNGTEMSNPDKEMLAVGTYNYTAVNSGDENYTGSSETWWLAVERAAVSLNLSADNWTVTYGTAANATCSADTSGITAVLYRNGTALAGLLDDEILGAGDHEYVCNATETENYTSAETSHILTIGKAATTTTLTIDGAAEDKEVKYGTTAVVLATTSAGTVKLYRNGVEVGNPDSAALAPGTYAYSAINHGNENYTESSSAELKLTVKRTQEEGGVRKNATTEISTAENNITGAEEPFRGEEHYAPKKPAEKSMLARLLSLIPYFPTMFAVSMPGGEEISFAADVMMLASMSVLLACFSYMLLRQQKGGKRRKK